MEESFVIKALDKFKQSLKVRGTENFKIILNFKVGAKVMIASNIKTEDKLFDILVEKMVYCKNAIGIKEKIKEKNYVKLEFERNTMQSNEKEIKWVLITKQEESFGIYQNKPQTPINLLQF